MSYITSLCLCRAWTPENQQVTMGTISNSEEHGQEPKAKFPTLPLRFCFYGCRHKGFQKSTCIQLSGHKNSSVMWRVPSPGPMENQSQLLGHHTNGKLACPKTRTVPATSYWDELQRRHMQWLQWGQWRTQITCWLRDKEFPTEDSPWWVPPPRHLRGWHISVHRELYPDALTRAGFWHELWPVPPHGAPIAALHLHQLLCAMPEYHEQSCARPSFKSLSSCDLMEHVWLASCHCCSRKQKGVPVFFHVSNSLKHTWFNIKNG